MPYPFNNRPTRVILLRHGQSTYNALGLYQGSSDRPILTELGLDQARLTGVFLRGINFDAIYASPLKRAKATAQEVLKVTGIHKTIEIAPQLRETELPSWQGLPFQSVKEQFPEDYRLWKQSPDEFRLEIPQQWEGERIRRQGEKEKGGTISLIPQPKTKGQNRQYFFPALDLYQRVRQFWQEILPRHIGQTLLIVSHGGTNRALISTAMGLTPKNYHRIQQSNCGISALSFADGQLDSGQLESMNIANHVGENLPQLKESNNGLRLLLIPAEETNSDSVEKLAQLLQEVKIDFSISGNLEHCPSMVESILKSHPKTVHLQVLREDFPQLWQPAIQSRIRSHSPRLLTGLVLANRAIIRRMLGEVLNLPCDRLGRLKLTTGTLSLVHYPNAEHPPILQAMNISVSQFNQLKAKLSTK
jgi:probable phosphoglycerate mutase